MINWIIDQSVVLSLVMILLMLSSRLSNLTFGATNTYVCWLIVPLSLVIGSIAHATQPQVAIEVYEVVQKIPLLSSHDETNKLTSFVNQLVYIWLFGILIISTSLGLNHRQFIKGLTKQSGKLDGEHTYAITNEGKTPFVVGLLSPMMVIPDGFKQLYSTEQQTLLIKHEHTHIKHGDLWWNVLAVALCITFWFNPIMWLAYRNFRHQQELACDQSVLHTQSLATRKLYADAMITAATSCRRGLFSPLHYSEVDTMKKRINALKSHRKNRLLPVAMVMTLSTATLGLAHTAIAGQKVKHDPIVVERVAPVYPVEAANNNIEGYVTVSFDVSKEGNVSDVRVVASDPVDVFNVSAINAVKQWRYAPSEHPVNDGLVQLDYKLSEDSTVVTPEYDDTEIVSVASEK